MVHKAGPASMPLIESVHADRPIESAGRNWLIESADDNGGVEPWGGVDLWSGEQLERLLTQREIDEILHRQV